MHSIASLFISRFDPFSWTHNNKYGGARDHRWLTRFSRLDLVDWRRTSIVWRDCSRLLFLLSLSVALDRLRIALTACWSPKLPWWTGYSRLGWITVDPAVVGVAGVLLAEKKCRRCFFCVFSFQRERSDPQDFLTGLAFRAKFSIRFTREEMPKMFLLRLFPPPWKDLTLEISRRV